MNRRSFFGALAGGLGAAVGIRPGLAGRTVTLLKGTAFGKSEMAYALAGDAMVPDCPSFMPAGRVLRFAARPSRPSPTGARPEPIRHVPAPPPGAAAPAVPDGNPSPVAGGPVLLDVSDRAAPDDLPIVWPGHSGAITATASLPPFAQLETLIELFGRSGDAAPSFAAALIGELVLTRMRLDAYDPRTLATLGAGVP